MIKYIFATDWTIINWQGSRNSVMQHWLYWMIYENLNLYNNIFMCSRVKSSFNFYFTWVTLCWKYLDRWIELGVIDRSS